MIYVPSLEAQLGYTVCRACSDYGEEDSGCDGGALWHVLQDRLHGKPRLRASFVDVEIATQRGVVHQTKRVDVEYAVQSGHYPQAGFWVMGDESPNKSAWVYEGQWARGVAKYVFRSISDRCS